MNTPTSTNEYLVISRGQWDKDASKEEIQTTIDEFYVWLARSVEEGRMKLGSRLALDGATVSKNRIVTDGPFGEAKEAIGGYWFILARSLDEATKIAAESPCLNRGLFYELRLTDPERATACSVASETVGE